MEWWAVLSVGLAVLLAVFLTGAPLFVGFLLINLCGIYLLAGGRGFVMVSDSIFDTAKISQLTAIPLFILMGEILTRSGSVAMLFSSMDGLIGKVRGRQYVLTILVSVIFGALCGAAMAVAAMMARSLYPTMMARKYDSKLSIGAILAGASLAPIIPPSVLVVIVATLADISVAKLLIAGILPGLVAAALFLVYIAVRVRLNPALSPDAETGAARPGLVGKLIAVAQMLPFTIIIFCVMGFILLGIATPSESAATGVVGSLVVAAIYRRLSWRMVWEALDATASMTAMILAIVVSSILFGQLLAFTGATRELIAFATGLSHASFIVMLVMLVVVFAMCMFIDQTALMLILVPIYVPLVTHLGLDPIWFWLLVLVNLTVGGITPPFGYAMFAFKAGAPGVGLPEIFSAVLPFVLLFIVLMALIVAFPPLATYLPGRI